MYSSTQTTVELHGMTKCPSLQYDTSYSKMLLELESKKDKTQHPSTRSYLTAGEWALGGIASELRQAD